MKLQKIKEIIKQANPDKKDAVFTLSDVLLVLRKHGTGIVFGGANDSFYSKTENKVKWLSVAWNLKDNNLDNQSPECLDFIFNLLKEQ